jgi:hypothetical protein
MRAARAVDDELAPAVRVGREADDLEQILRGGVPVKLAAPRCVVSGMISAFRGLPLRDEKAGLRNATQARRWSYPILYEIRLTPRRTACEALKLCETLGSPSIYRGHDHTLPFQLVERLRGQH